MTLNGSKIYGPKGSGVLFKKKEVELAPIIHGGEQEFGLRPGTENVAGIVGFAKALEITEKIKIKESVRLTKLRDYFISKLLKLNHSNILKNVRISVNGDLKNRLPNNVNISVSGFESELLVLELDAKGIAVSSKSACKTESEEFYVIKALRQSSGQAINPNFDSKKEGVVRFSLGRNTQKKDIDYVIQSIKLIIQKYI